MHKVVLLLASALLAGAAEGHHSVPTRFDTSSEHTITGTIKTIRWVNPHSSLYIEFTNESGQLEKLRVEMNAIDTIRRFSSNMGFSTDDFVIGDVITVGGWLGHDKQSLYFRNATLASGKKIVWQSGPGPDQAAP
jgi:hypothetical protein